MKELMRWKGFAVALAATLTAACSDERPMAPDPEPEPEEETPVLMAIVHGYVEAHGMRQAGVPVEVRALLAADAVNAGSCDPGRFYVVGQEDAITSDDGEFRMGVVADPEHELVAGHEQLEVCLHVIGHDPAGEPELMLYDVADQRMMPLGESDTTFVVVDISALIEES